VARAADGLHCFASDGTLIGKLRLPEVVSNLTFGGPKLNHLFVTASTSVYSLRVNFRCRPLMALVSRSST
jgi:gluconolactonase